MASNHTQHYGLSQWAPGDAFVRTEFNGDNEKVDAALKAVAEEAARVERSAAGAAAGAQATAQRALDALVPVRYNVYNLALQQHYEGKETGWKQGMVFDVFLDGTMIASKSTSLVLGGGMVTLPKTITTDAEVPNGPNYQYDTSSVSEALPVTAPGGALLYRLKCIWKAASSNQVGTQTLNFIFYVNGVRHHEESHAISFAIAQQEGYLNLRTQVPVKAGDEVHFVCSGLGSYYKMPIVHGSFSKIYAAYVFKPLYTGAGTGSLTSVAAAMPACGGARGWVRHAGGTVSLSLRSGGVSREMARTGSRGAVSLQGKACTETEFKLDGALAAGSYAVTLGVSLGGGETAAVLDYGVILG